MNWLALAILTAVFYGLYNIFIKVSSGHIHEIVGAVILQLVAAVLGIGILAFLKIKGIPLEISKQGIGFAVLSGLFVGLAEITSFYVFSKGVPAAVGIPVIVGGSVVIGALAGFFFLKESLHLSHLIGIALIVGGVILLAR